jgi:hypothetical protein
MPDGLEAVADGLAIESRRQNYFAFYSDGQARVHGG